MSDLACRLILRDVPGEPLALVMFAASGGELIGQAELEPHVALRLAEGLIASTRGQIVTAGVEVARSGDSAASELPAKEYGLAATVAFIAAAGLFGSLAGAGGALAAAGVRALGLV